MLWKIFNKKILKKRCNADNNEELIAIPLPTETFYGKNNSLLQKVYQENSSEGKAFYLSIMDELLRCQTRFMTSIYLSLFLSQDHDNEQLDAKVFNFLTGTYSSHNEMIELCEDLCRAMNSFQDNDFYDSLKGKIFIMNFKDVRLPVFPLLTASDRHLKEKCNDYADKIIAVNKKLVEKKLAFLKSENVFLHISLHGEKIVNELEVYKDNVESFLLDDNVSFTENLAEKYINDTGSCWINLPGVKEIRLDPLLIPLRNPFRKLRLASLFNMASMSNGLKCRLEYIELFGDEKFFSTNNKELFRDIFYQKGNVLESPVFPHRYIVKSKNGNEIAIKLYDGDILNLNFLKGIRKNDSPRKKAALVNIIYKDGDKTELADALESIADINLREITKDKLLARNDTVISSSKVGELNFYKIYHCPVYSRSSSKNDEKNIEATIDNILTFCMKDGIEILVAPSFGSFQAGQDRDKVARKWHEAICNFQKNSFLGFKDKNFLLRQIIFGFINRQAMNTYHRVFLAKTTEAFSNFHYPVAKLMHDINNIAKDEDRFGVNLDLVEYFYQFFTAMALRSISRDIHVAAIKKEDYRLDDKKSKFLAKLQEISGLGEQIFTVAVPAEDEKKEMVLTGTRMTVGKWQLLSQLGINAIKDDVWGYEQFFAENGHLRKIFLQTINSSQPSAIRNMVAHSTRNLKTNIPYHDHAEKLEEESQLFLQSTGFFDQQQLSIIMIKSFEVDEDRLACKLEYLNLKGLTDMSYPPIKKIIFKYHRYYQGPYFETGKVFLVKKLPEDGGEISSHFEALNMFPFLIYGKCPVCANENGFYVWYDFKYRDDKLTILYRPLICTCNLDNAHYIGDFLMADIMESIAGIFAKFAETKQLS